MNKECLANPFFSIIVPLYNAEKYLAECIDSVVAQSFENWELILVDDGSEDTSFHICKEYEAADSRIKAYTKANGGSFSGRRYGLERAIGQYVTCVDADDKLGETFLFDLFNILRIKDYDCVMWSYTLFGEAKGQQIIPNDIIGEYTQRDFLKMVLETTWHAFNTKVFKKDIIDKTDFSNAPRLHISEDYIMVIPLLCNIQTALVTNKYTYYYRVTSDSMSHSSSYTKLLDLCEASRFGLQKISELCCCDKELISSENIGFLKCFFSRFADAIYYDNISYSQIESIYSHERYIDVEETENRTAFGMRIYIEMKLIRNKKIRLYKFYRSALIKLKKIKRVIVGKTNNV